VIRLGFIGCGGRAGEHLKIFQGMKQVQIASLCDPDPSKTSAARERFAPSAKEHRDLRHLIDDKQIDAVIISACNHWHCLAAIWAMQAGKDVYVEKPLSHSQWEGMQTVAAARKYQSICQVGTQQRSDPMQAEIKKFLHEDKVLGNILSARVNRYGVRKSIGKTESALVVDPKIDYNLWLGPAQDLPMYRKEFHYDWHWNWNTGSGEMGNWGVHVLDDCRNVVFRDSVTLPKRIIGGGGRVAWNDDGQTPNVHFALFDTGSIPVVIGLTNLAATPESNKSPHIPGPGSGYVVYCEGGRYEGQRGSGVAFDSQGKEIRRFKGNSGHGLHQRNFIDCVLSRDSSKLMTEVKVGHDSTGWCNLANVAFRAGGPFSEQAARNVDQDLWQKVVEEMSLLLKSHGMTMENAGLSLSPMLTMDVAKEQFVGEGSQQANSFLRREYRAPFVVPDQV
jgi:predicted dehydrogenase